MSFRKGIATGLTTLLAGSTVVAASSDSCLGSEGYILPNAVYETMYTYQGFLQRAGTAVILGATFGLIYTVMTIAKEENERRNERD